MEKKVIDLQHEEGEVEILLPKNWKWNTKKGNYIDSMILELPKKNPLDLIPKSWEELCDRLSIELDEDAAYHRLTGFCPLQDINAFVALMMLRRLWREWVEVLGTPNWENITQKFTLAYNCNDNQFIVVDWNYTRFNGLSFTSREIAEKFIECFKDLLEKAKLLL